MSQNTSDERPVVDEITTTEPETVDGNDISFFGDDEPVQQTDTTSEPGPVQADEPSEDENTFTPNLPVRKTVLLTKTVFRPVGAKDKYKIALFGTGKRASTLPNNDSNWVGVDDMKNTELVNFAQRWASGLSKQTTVSYSTDGRGMYDRILDEGEPDSWTQGFLSPENRDIYLTRSNIKKASKPRQLTGGAVRDIISQSIGLSSGLRIPLPHTGPHITIGPRSTEDYIALDVQRAQDKRELGRHTIGVIFQNSHIALVERVCEFISGSIRRYNRVSAEDYDIFSEIKVTDLPILQWAMACTMHPEGYPYDIPCSSGPTTCKHIEHVNLDLEKMMWINTARLSVTQRAKLENVGHQFTDEDIKLYETGGRSPFTKVITVGKYAVTLKVPTIAEYLEAGRVWIDELSLKAKEMFNSENGSEGAQREYVNRLITTASLREYSSWISKIVVDEFNEVIGAEDIAVALESLSDDKEVTEKILAKIQEFIEDSTVALIAIPNFACPICEKDYVTDEFSKHPELIPIDVMKLFFDLVDRKVYLPAANIIE